MILLGDPNAHHEHWLHYSTTTNHTGRFLRQLATDHGLTQLVKAPTHLRGNLLDLVLTDLQNFSHVQLLAPIADHSVVLLRLDVGTVTSPPIQSTSGPFVSCLFLCAGPSYATR